MLSSSNRRLFNLVRSERGITGLETAIILIAFVVVASVFAYTVLTAGVFSAQKSNETVNAAIEEVRSTLILGGTTIAYKGAIDLDGATATTDTVDAVVKVDVTLAVALAGVPADVTPAYQINPNNKSLERAGTTNTFVINYLDQNQLIKDVAYTTSFTGANDGDTSLEPTERAVLTIWLVEYEYENTRGLYYKFGGGAADPFIDTSPNILGRFDPFTFELTPVQGAPLVMEKVVPQALNDIMNLR